MRIREPRLSATFKAIIALAGIIGILLQVGVFDGVLRLSVFNYYTLLSNVLVTLYFIPASFYAARDDRTWQPQLKGAVTMGITVTFLIYHFALAGNFAMEGTQAWSNRLLHYIVPLMAIADWLFFSDKGELTWYSPLLWVLLPDLYFIYVQLRLAFGASLGTGSRYPYYFIDVDALGWGQVLLNGLLINLAFIVLGYVVVLIDYLLARQRATSEA